MRTALIIGCINYYESAPGWRHVHVDVTDRQIYDARTQRFRQPEVQADVRDLPCASGTVDRVQLWDVLEHLDEPGAYDALRELARVIRQGGELDIQVPDVSVAAAWYIEGNLAFAELLQILYGERLPNDPREADIHRWGWDAGSLAGALHRAGFEHGPNLGVGTVVARFRAVRLLGSLRPRA